MKAIAEAAGVDISDEGEDTPDLWVVIEWGMELRFEIGREELRQLSVEDEEYHWAGKPVVGVPMHEALFALGDAVHGAGWRMEDPACNPFDDLQPTTGDIPPDKKLMKSGTIWLPACGLGLTLGDGIVSALLWRRAQDMPAQFIGPVTEAQIRLSMESAV
jgi:hypothetical protein